MEREIENKIINKEENIPDENQNIEHSTIINSNNRIIYADPHNHEEDNRKNLTIFMFIFTILIIVLIFIIILFAISFFNGSEIINKV